jgi:hypothetical protein
MPGVQADVAGTQGVHRAPREDQRQPVALAAKAATTVKKRSLCMARISIVPDGVRGDGCGGAQLYIALGDVQPRRATFFNMMQNRLTCAEKMLHFYETPLRGYADKL